MKVQTWLFITVLAISVVSIAVVAIYYSSLLVSQRPLIKGMDIFGIDEIYHKAKEAGREWYIDMENPFSDDLLWYIWSRYTKQEDSSWRVTGPAVRLNVGTPSNAEPWKNVEITGYTKILESISSSSSSSANGDRAGDNSSGEEEERNFTSDLDWRAYHPPSSTEPITFLHSLLFLSSRYDSNLTAVLLLRL